MLITPAARELRAEIDERLNPGYRHAEPARLLADAYALARTLAETTESLPLKRDCLDSAFQIESYLLETLSELRITRDDVETMFEQMREERPGWPSAIPPASWGRLVSARTLRDITDVLCGGGDYWEAIRVALDDEFGLPVGTVERWSPRTLYLAFHEDDWNDAQALVGDLSEDEGRRLTDILDRVRERSDDRFAMVVWSVQDILDATARAKNDDFGELEEATWEQAGVSREWVEEVMGSVSSALMDRMTERGWEVLEDAVREALQE